MMESPTAEVIWYAVPNGRSIPGDATPRRTSDPIQLYTLYRRVLLVGTELVPYVQHANVATFSGTFRRSTTSTTSRCDSRRLPVRCRQFSLTDLTNRQNRFLHAFALPGLLVESQHAHGAAAAWTGHSRTARPRRCGTIPFPAQNPSYIILRHDATYVVADGDPASD